MRKLIVLFAFTPLLICGFQSHGQSFCLSDSEFQIGDTLRKTIIFSFNYPQILPESYPFMDSLVDFLNIHSNLCLRIESNTDIRGSIEFNDTLSDRRAKSVVNYLVDKGINSDRLTSIGMGEKAPIIKEEEILAFPTREEQEKAHALNRQTVFRIIGCKK
ncbi:MAG: OmpA family protein [Bacteroidales bacterium]|nr:OmpA family protein [Bacteroidales bacterium]